jgi:hypothetical protein
MPWVGEARLLLLASPLQPEIWDAPWYFGGIYLFAMLVYNSAIEFHLLNIS